MATLCLLFTSNISVSEFHFILHFAFLLYTFIWLSEFRFWWIPIIKVSIKSKISFINMLVTKLRQFMLNKQTWQDFCLQNIHNESNKSFQLSSSINKQLVGTIWTNLFMHFTIYTHFACSQNTPTSGYILKQPTFIYPQFADE